MNAEFGEPVGDRWDPGPFEDMTFSREIVAAWLGLYAFKPAYDFGRPGGEYLSFESTRGERLDESPAERKLRLREAHRLLIQAGNRAPTKTLAAKEKITEKRVRELIRHTPNTADSRLGSSAFNSSKRGPKRGE